LFDSFPPKQHFVHVTHVHHVNDTAQVRTPALPPCEFLVQEEGVPDVNLFTGVQFFQLHSVQQRLVNTTGHPAAESRRVVVFLHLPDRDGVDDGREGPIIPAG
jgi:hypothetical protein